MPPTLRLTSNLPVVSLHKREHRCHTHSQNGGSQTNGWTEPWTGLCLPKVRALLSSSNSLLPCRDAGPRLPDQILQWKPEIQTLLQHLLALNIGYKSYIKKKKISLKDDQLPASDLRFYVVED